MGIANAFLRAIVAAAFLATAGFAYFLSVQRGKIESNRVEDINTSFLFSSENIRLELISALSTDATQDAQDLSAQLARMKPMSEVPYEAAMALGFSRGENDLVEQFAAQAIFRQPRSLAARLQLFRSAATRLEYQRIFYHYERLIELRSLNGRLLSSALIGIFRDSNDWSMLFDYLATNPPNGLFLVNQLLREDRIPDGFGRVLLNFPSQQENYLRRVIDEQGLKDAYIQWTSYAALPSETDEPRQIFNGRFQDKSAPAPFNWSIHSSRAELGAAGGLSVSYSGVGNPLIARQIFSAPSGSFTLQTIASGRMQQGGGGFEWRVFCTMSDEVVKNSDISKAREFSNEVFETELTVPDENCDFQTIELRARAGRFPKSADLELTSVAIVPVNAQDSD